MKYFILVLLILPALLMSLLPASEQPVVQDTSVDKIESSTNDEADPGYVVLELFTSQGCSSCPSADDLLAQLDASNDQVIALSFHVDYWNYLGWADPFSSPYFSARQSDYTSVLRARTYTPQLVINGQEELIGSRAKEVRQSVAKAKGSVTSAGLSVSTTTEGREVTVNYDLTDVPTGHRVTALLVQPAATSAIQRGENRGRELHHVNVVRGMEHADAATSGRFTLTAPEDLDPQVAEVIVLLQDKKTLKIVGVMK